MIILKDAATSKGQEEEVDHLEKTTTSRGQKRNMNHLERPITMGLKHRLEHEER
jgi:hypothetical protein